MKVRVNKIDLSKATSRLQGALVDTSLAHISLKAEKGHLKLAGNDRTIAIYTKIEAQVDEEAEAFVPAGLFSGIVKELPNGEVALTTDKSWLTILAGKNNSFSMKIPLIENLTWRTPPSPESFTKSIIPSDKFSYMIHQVQFCIAQQSPRNYGAVGYLHKPKSGQLRLVGTDGFRLSYCDIDHKFDKDFLKSGICISKRALSELSKISSEGFENITLSVSVDGTSMSAEVPDYQIFIRLSAVKYPNYQGVIPKVQPTHINVSRGQLQSMSKRVLLAADKKRALLLSFSDSSLTLSSKNMGNSEGKETLPINGYEGAGLDIAVNGKYLTDVFSTVSSDDIDLQIKNDEDPVVIVPKAEPQDCHSCHVLVPIKEGN